MRVLDSNILIYYLNGAIPPPIKMRVDSWIEEGVFISVVTRIEVLGFRQHANALNAAEQLLAFCQTVPLHASIAERTILLRRIYSIKLPDAIIAATALDLDMPIVSRNEEISVELRNSRCTPVPGHGLRRLRRVNVRRDHLRQGSLSSIDLMIEGRRL